MPAWLIPNAPLPPHHLCSFCNRKFSVKTVVMLADQMVGNSGVEGWGQECGGGGLLALSAASASAATIPCPCSVLERPQHQAVGRL